jgi:signal transduction histidine kinase
LETALCRYESAEGPRALAIARDVTARMQLVQRQRRRDAAANHAREMEALGRLAGGIAHELNNLMTVITLNAELLREGASPPAAKADPLERIRRAAEQATTVTRSLLALGRPRARQRTPADLNEQLRELGPVLRPLVGEGVDLELRLAPGRARVEADPSEIGMLVTNLVVNARDALRRGGRILVESVRVDLREPEPSYAGWFAPGAYAGLHICDSGPAVDEAAPHPVQPLSSGDGPGTGRRLGRAEVHAMVSRLGGDLRIASGHEEETCFEVLLPLAERDPPTRGPNPAPPNPRGDETILLVEDQPEVRRAIGRALRELGYQVIEADSSERALEIARSFDGRLDLVLTDVVMPGTHGPQLVRQIREGRPETRVLFVTGHAGEAFEFGVPVDHSVLEKPFTASALAARVRAVLDRAGEPAEPPPGKPGPRPPQTMSSTP